MQQPSYHPVSHTNHSFNSLFTVYINLYHLLGIFSRQQIDSIFSYFSQKTGLDISYKLSPLKNVSAENFTQSAKH